VVLYHKVKTITPANSAEIRQLVIPDPHFMFSLQASISQQVVQFFFQFAQTVAA